MMRDTRSKLVACWLGLLLLLPACVKPPGMREAKPPTSAQLAEFVRHTGIVFPAGTVPLLWWEERGMDDALFIKVSLPAESVAAFLAQPPFVGTKLSGPKDFPDAVLHGFADWMPHPPKAFQFCEPSLPNARYMKCVFDFDDPKNTLVYLMWFET